MSSKNGKESIRQRSKNDDKEVDKHTTKRKGMWTLKKLNADQVLSLARSSMLLPCNHFELWALVLCWCFRLYAVEFDRSELDCGSPEIDICDAANECFRHMGRRVVQAWISVFGDEKYRNFGFQYRTGIYTLNYICIGLFEDLDLYISWQLT